MPTEPPTIDTQIVPDRYTHNGFTRLDIGLTLEMMNRTGKQAVSLENQPTGPWTPVEPVNSRKALFCSVANSTLTIPHRAALA